MGAPGPSAPKWGVGGRVGRLLVDALRLSTLLLLVLAGCSPPPTALMGLRVVAAPDANERMATWVDIVFVFDDAAITAMPDNAGDWFANKPTLMGRHPGALKVVSLQVPPGDWINPVPLPEGSQCAYKVIAYPNLRDPQGRAALDLTPLLHAQINLSRVSAQAFEIPPPPKESPP